MENLEFILGIFTTIGIFGLGYAIVGVFKVKTETNNLVSDINNAYTAIENLENDVRINSDSQEQGLQDQIDDIYRSMDSRFDKFENKLNK